MKIYMKKMFPILLLAAFIGLSFLLPVAAQPADPADPETGLDTGIGSVKSPIEGDVNTLVSRITKFIQPITAVAFVFVIVYGGFVRLWARGNPEQEQKSNMILTAGIVGFLIIVLAPVIVKLVASLVGYQSDVI